MTTGIVGLVFRIHYFDFAGRVSISSISSIYHPILSQYIDVSVKPQFRPAYLIYGKGDRHMITCIGELVLRIQKYDIF